MHQRNIIISLAVSYFCDYCVGQASAATPLTTSLVEDIEATIRTLKDAAAADAAAVAAAAAAQAAADEVSTSAKARDVSL